MPEHQPGARAERRRRAIGDESSAIRSNAGRLAILVGRILRLLLCVSVPGWSHRVAGHPGRGRAVFGSYASAIVVAVAGWGTPFGFGFLAVAVVAHVVSIVELIRNRTVPMVRTDAASLLSGVLLLGFLYGPLLHAAYRHAKPIDHAGSRFFVDDDLGDRARLRSGQWIAFDSTVLGLREAVAQVLAVGGQWVECDGEWLVVDGVRVRRDVPIKTNERRDSCRFEVPEDQVLVRCLVPLPDDARLGGILRGVALVERRQISGRAWLRVSSPWDVTPLGSNDRTRAVSGPDPRALALIRNWPRTCRDSSINPTLDVRRHVDRDGGLPITLERGQFRAI